MIRKRQELPDLKTLSTDELTELLNGLVDSHQEINLKITTAKARAKVDGVYMDTMRFHNLSYAKNQVNKKLRRVELELSSRKRATRESLGDHFMEAAHVLLEKSTFERVLAEARERISSA